MSEIKIYQGNQIGGCVTVILAEVHGVVHRIMIDYGSSLQGSNIKDEFIYPWEEEPIDAVFFTHYHGDHVGRIMEIPENIPLYMGNTARKVMIHIQEALVGIRDKEEASFHQKKLDVLLNDERIHTFRNNGKTYDSIDEIPGFHIEPYSVDHSAYDAYMFLIEAIDTRYEGGKKVILHTGDFRRHGRRGKAMIPVIRYYVHKGGRQVHTLITEGSMMSRLNEEVKTETEMMFEAVEYLKKYKYVFLVCSSTNLDSLASFYQAAQIAAKPYERYMYVYNDYLKKQLQTFSEIAGNFSDVYRFQHIYKLRPDKELISPKWEKSKTQKELMERTGFLAIIKPEEWCDKYIAPFIEDYKTGKINQMPVIIYSMWSGYVDRNHKAKNQEWIDFFDKQEERGVEIFHLHTSGHASADTLTDVIHAVSPTEEIIPIHTENAWGFRELNLSDEFKDRVKQIE